MTTLVGIQDNFVTALQELVELDFDAAEAYLAAINRLDNLVYRTKLQEFREDHLRHIRELTELLQRHGEDAPTGPSAVKQWLTKGKVVLADLAGDHAILAAMKSNEDDTNTAYERMVAHKNKWLDAEDTLQRGLSDERRHREWLESIK